MSDNKSVKLQVIESGTEFEGVLHTEHPVIIGGRMKGEVVAPTLTLTEQGSVHGKLKVKELRSLGTLGGEIDAEIVELSGNVTDNTLIRSATLEVKLAESDGNNLQTKFGNCELIVGDATRREKSLVPEQESVGVN